MRYVCLRLIIQAAAALALLCAASVQGGDNPWGNSLDKFNIPAVHGSGVFVDLGNQKHVNSSWHREPAGRCPVIGKRIRLLQPTTNPTIWPNNYLERVPAKNSPQNATPLGGGLAMWETTPTVISPLTISQLKHFEKEQRKKNEPNSDATKRLQEVQDEHGLCAWWAWVTYAKGSNGQKMDEKYRYPFVWDEETQTCTLLAIAMQLLDGHGKYCTKGDGSPKLTWYCFHPEKVKAPVSYNSAYVRPDHAKACPEKAVKGAHFGVWDGSRCERMIPRARKRVASPMECGVEVFMKSASDHPTKYTRTPSSLWETPSLKGQSSYSLSSLSVATPGAFGADQPHSKGVGINYANWYLDGFCEMYDTVPTCFVKASGQLAFTSLGSIDPHTAELPPCNKASEGWIVGGYCDCEGGDDAGPWKCEAGNWRELDEDKECECKGKLPLALGVGLGLLLPVAGLVAYLLYRRRKPQQRKPGEKERMGLLDDDDESDREFERSQQRKKHRQTDMVQEAEPSFWGDNYQDKTNVVVDEGPAEAFY